MHMSDALVSVPVGVTMLAISAAAIGCAVKKLSSSKTEDSIFPMMGVMGAFIFAAQMINFTIPGTGSSGHIGGGLLLAILLGPWAGFLVLASVLALQALLFADGGLLAYGCNLFNLGFWPCLVVYPLIYRAIANPEARQSNKRIYWACIAASIIGLQLGAFGVVLQTKLSGITELPFNYFLLAMQPIHLAIGLIEGLVTAMIILFVSSIQGNIFTPHTTTAPSRKRLIVLFLSMAIATGGVAAWFASGNPDGLEWAIGKTSGHEELPLPEQPVHQLMAAIQEQTSILPDYGFPDEAPGQAEEHPASSWPNINAGTTLSGLTGAVLLILLFLPIGYVLRYLGTRTNTIRE